MDFSTDGRYVAYGGQTRPAGASPITILGIYDLARRQRVQQDSIVCKDCSDGELRHLSISSDGNRIIAGDWGQRVHYYVRSDTTSRWQRVQSLDVGSRVYWTDMSADNSLAVVGMQGTDVRLYSLGTSS
ncbi:MAG: hypothetical protein HY703_01185 [Gemmatimonadetes bacterium]|nr:hypothetical protein [Gemmatimonadota bacterium]